MKAHNEKPLLSSAARDKYVGRLDEFERLYLHALNAAEPFGLRVSAPPFAGASELLRQVFDRLFREQRFVVPFYFSLRSGDGDAVSAAARYTYQFLLQAIAFRRREPELITASPNICELEKLAPLSDVEWVRQIVETCEKDGRLNDDLAYIRTALAAPLRAAVSGRLRVCLIIDDLHVSGTLDQGRMLMNEMLAFASSVRTPVILGSRRRFVLSGIDLPVINIAPLEREEAALLAEMVAADFRVVMGEEARDLIVAKFGRDPWLIRSFILAARDAGRTLESYRDVERLYTDELHSGRIRDHFDRIFERAAPEPVQNQRLVEALYFIQRDRSDEFSIGALGERLGITTSEALALAERLDIDEIFEVQSGSVRFEPSIPLRDFLESRYRTVGEHRTRAFAAIETITNSLKRAPQLMARAYRSEAALDLLGMLGEFDIQAIPRGLIDFRVFRDRFKGVQENELNALNTDESDLFVLPQIARTAPIIDLFPEFGEPVEPERAVAGIGFADRAYRDEDRINWFAVEVDSKLEADHSLVSEWCDRLDAAAAACGFDRYLIWMLAPEGFTDGALDLLAERNGLGTSRKQFEMLRSHLNKERSPKPVRGTEYEIVIPMGEDTEMIAAHALEEIARRHNFPVKSINQIKTALVEACINATEHSLSPDNKIYQKFTVDEEKIVITVSNRGLRLSDKVAPEPTSGSDTVSGRRGWGLNLIRGLMDDVQIKSVDDGTAIVMTKYLQR